jgi:hypothetical protein
MLVVTAIACGCRSRANLFRDHAPVAAARHIAIEEELTSLGDHDWAGEYRTQSNLTGDRVLLAPQGGVVHQPWHDYGFAWLANSGRVVAATDDVITLDFDLPTMSDDRPLFQAELIRIRWGSRRYLVWRDRLDRFEAEVARRPLSQTEFASAMMNTVDAEKPFGSHAELESATARASKRAD